MGRDQRNIFQRHVIGRLIIDGPRALFPPKHIDDIGWLEPDLHIYECKAGWHRSESITLLCDDTMNRERSFLTPMVRHVVWERQHDLDKNSRYPHIHVRYGTVSDWTAVKRIGRQVQRALQTVPFIAYGHSKTRRGPNVKLATDGGEYRVMTRNGMQYIEFASPELADDPLVPVIRKAKDALQSLTVSIDSSGWREKYDYDIPSLAPQKSWEWTIGSGFLDDWEPI